MFEPKPRPDLDQDALAIVDRGFKLGLERFQAEQAAAGESPEPAAAPVVTPATTAPTGPRDVPPDVLASYTDDGAVRHEPAGLLSSIPPNGAQPAVVAAFQQLTHENGSRLKGLSEQAAAIAFKIDAQERKASAVRLIEDLEGFAAPAETALRRNAAELRAEADRLDAELLESGGDLDPQEAREIAAWFRGLDANDRAAVLGRAERAGDFAILRIIALDRLNGYALPELDQAQLLATAGRLRTPGKAASAVAYRTLAERAERNAGTVARQVADAERAARQHVSADDLNFARRVARGTQGAGHG